MPRPLVPLDGVDLEHVQVDTAGIEAVNPQRGAMRHLDAVVRFVPAEGFAIGARDVRAGEFWSAGHFPGRPLLPGVLIVEACAQLCSYMANTELRLEGGKTILFAGIEEARFRGAVVPGDRLVLVAVRRDVKPRLVRFDCQALVGAGSAAKIVFDGTILGIPRMTNTREHLERREDATLAPWAARAGASRGRRHPEEEAAFRTAFMRDRDRIVHSTAFRRLEYKTQVFVNHKGDYYRTRLTHTIETSQIARTIARALGANEDLCEAVALAHDLGHTPFGHAGQDALDVVMREHGGFEHNRQSLRVVDVLERRYAGFRGLNLTYEVRESIAKHGARKEGLAEVGIDPDPAPLVEAQIADAADSIAYDNHDIDDGLKAGAITLADLDALALWRRTREQVLAETGRGIADEILARHVVRRLIGQQVSDLIGETARRIERHRIATLADVRAANAPLVALSEPLHGERAELKRFLFARVYRHYAVCRMAEKAKRFIEALFRELVRYPKSLPPDFQAWADEVGTERAVADYIAGMTDRFAQTEYQRLFAPFEIE